MRLAIPPPAAQVTTVRLTVEEHSAATEEELQPFLAAIIYYVAPSDSYIVQSIATKKLYMVLYRHLSDRVNDAIVPTLSTSGTQPAQFLITDQMVDGETGEDVSNTWTSATILNSKLPGGYYLVRLDEYWDPCHPDNWHMAFDVVTRERLRW